MGYNIRKKVLYYETSYFLIHIVQIEWTDRFIYYNNFTYKTLEETIDDEFRKGDTDKDWAIFLHANLIIGKKGLSFQRRL